MPIDDYPFHILKNPGIITASTIGLAYTPTLDGAGLTSADDASRPWLQHATEAVAGRSAWDVATTVPRVGSSRNAAESAFAKRDQRYIARVEREFR